MTLHIIYESATGTTIDLSATDRVRLPGFEVTANAEEGTIAQSQLLVEDSGGSLDIVGMRRWWAYEDAEEDGNKIIAHGFVGDREIGRDAGGPEPFVVGADRRWSVGLVDKEALLSDRVLTGPFADRPAETDIARITALLASGFLPGVSDSLGYIDTVGAVSLSASPFSGQRPYDLLSDCAQQSNKNFFLIKTGENVTTGVSTWALWYAYDYHAQYTSSLRLTNVLADVDNTTTFAVDPDLILRRTPERVYSGVLVRYNNGEVYQQDIDTANGFRYRDAVHPGVNVADGAVATARGLRYLADADTEEDRITCRFSVPKESVNGLREGQRVQFKFSHLPGYSTTEYAYARCVRRTVRQLSDEFYELRVELVPQGPLTAGTASLYGPNDNNLTSGAFRVNWDGRGDDGQPPGGCVVLPLSGPFEYVGVTDEWTGLRCLGDGLVTLSSHGTVSGSTAGGTHVLRAAITVNGTEVVFDTQTTSGGARAISWTWALALADVAVRSGDVVETWFTAAPVPNIMVIPAGVGNCANLMTVSGSLRV